ncbi:hypothetical protein AB0C33_01925 [Nonomuraea sp. NPDC048881]|uniref:hypothetical protein n=1 Tax=Nonomuraea sp. NPDC048881 TaxID=3155030 RepID=UPI0033C491CE
MRQLGDAAYGEQAAFQEAQAGAPMAMDNLAAGGPGAAPGAPVEVTPFGAASSRPGEPVTAGAPVGAGVGLEALGLTTPDELLRQDKQTLSTYLPVLEFLANQPNAMPSLRTIVRQIKAAVNA